MIIPPPIEVSQPTRRKRAEAESPIRPVEGAGSVRAGGGQADGRRRGGGAAATVNIGGKARALARQPREPLNSDVRRVIPAAPAPDLPDLGGVDPAEVFARSAAAGAFRKAGGGPEMPVLGDEPEPTPREKAAEALSVSPPELPEQARKAPSEASPPSPSTGGQEALSPEEQRVLRELQARDQEVRNHEQAHKNVGGPYAGTISYVYQTGPDNKQYAIGGEVPIDVSEVPNDPEATARKMDVVRRAALAPKDPSGADRRIASRAAAQAAKARQEAAAQRYEEAKGDDDETGPASATDGAASETTTGPRPPTERAAERISEAPASGRVEAGGSLGLVA